MADEVQTKQIQQHFLERQLLELARTTMTHCIIGLIAKSVSLITDESDNHAVEVEEEHEEVEAKLDEGFLRRRIHVSKGLIYCEFRE